jgi:hypothetical protein
MTTAHTIRISAFVGFFKINQRAENLKMVVWLYSWPGRSAVEGKLGWLGESGKCWVSRQKPLRRV